MLKTYPLKSGKKFFSTINYKPKIKNPLGTKKIKLDPKEILKDNSVEIDQFISYCGNQGLFIIKNHLNWLFKNNIINPNYKLKKGSL